MSLIQEALKRKKEERHMLPTQAVIPPPKPPTPPNPIAGIPPPHSSERKLFLILTVTFILILLIIGISIYAVLNAPKQELPSIETALPVTIVETIKPVVPPPIAIKALNEKPENGWPNLTFSGSASAGNQQLAIINGRMLSVGNEVLGVKVLEIGKTQVLVGYKGEKRVLSVGDE